MAGGRLRRIAAALLLIASCAAAAEAQPLAQAPLADPADAEALDFGVNRTDRMTVEISIGGRPYRFIVDTGSERTVVSRQLAEQQRFAAGLPATVHSMTEVSVIRTAVVPALRVGRRTVSNIHAPILEEVSLGADGLLGVDSLASQRVELDFLANVMTISPSRHRERFRPEDDTIVVTARSRFGRLILVDASFDGERVWVILDTGSEVSIANEALRRRLERRHRLGPTAPLEVVSVTGGRRVIDYGMARRLRIGSAEIMNLPVGFADVEPFRKLGLTERPAILLGMDALQLFDHVTLDFATREVQLRMGRSTGRPAMAARASGVRRLAAP
jgi:predicted aspartyl protease